MRARTVLLFVLAVVLGACAHVGAGATGAATPIRAMTYNIRLDLASDGANAWPNRKDLVAAVIRREAPDVLGMQEVLLVQKRDLEAALPGYAMAGVGRDDGKDAGEFSPLAWRRDRFDALRQGTFWLSPTPDKPGKGWDAAYPRLATWAVLRDRRSGRDIRVLNTHFDHVGTVARASAARMIADWATNGADAALPTILMGDFNSTPDSEPYRILAARLSDARTASAGGTYGPAGTFNAWKIDSDAAAPIDHVFINRHVAAERYAVITQHWGGQLPSDHYPVVVDLTYRP